jgi:excisionase family DNA binding protein
MATTSSSEARSELLTAAEVASLCKLSVKAVYRAVSSGELRATKLCGRVRVEPADLDDWIGRNRVRAEPRPIQLPPVAATRSGLGSLQALRAIERRATA